MSDAVLPAWDAARDGGRRLVSLRRGWLGGPHVEVAGTGPGADAVTWDELARAVDVGPAPASPIDPAEYLDRARVRGRLENVVPPYLPLRDHGTTVLLDLSSDELGSSHLARLGGLTDAVLAPAVVRSVRAAAGEVAQTGRITLDVLTCVAAAHALGVGHGTFSLRSHAEALLAHWSRRSDLRPEFLRRYGVQRPQLVARVETLLAGEGGGEVTAWQTALAYSQGVIDEAVRRGELTNAIVDAAGEDTQRSDEQPAGDHPDTDFHRKVYGSGATESAGEWFAGYRFLVNHVYTQLPLIGISPLQRAYGCWSVAEAVDEVLGESWTERLTAEVEREETR